MENYSFNLIHTVQHSLMWIYIDPKTKDVDNKKAEIVTTYRGKVTPDAKIKRMLDAYWQMWVLF